MLPGATFNPNAPQRVDPTTLGVSIEILKARDRFLEKNSRNSRRLKEEQFYDEFRK